MTKYKILNKHKNRFKKKDLFYCLCITMLQRKIDLAYSLQKRKFKKRKNKHPSDSHGENKQVNSTIPQRQHHTWPSSSFSHFSIFFLFFYTSDVQNIIAPAETKHKSLHCMIKLASKNYLKWHTNLYNCSMLVFEPLIYSNYKHAVRSCFM